MDFRIIARKDGRRFRLSSRPSEHCEGSDTSGATFRNCLEDRLKDSLFGSTEHAKIDGSRQVDRLLSDNRTKRNYLRAPPSA